MAKHIKRIVFVVQLDADEVPIEVVVRRYRVEDDDTPGVRLPESGRNVAMALGDMNKIMHSTGAVGEVVKDCVALCRTDAGIEGAG